MEDNMKVDFSTILFMDESHPILDGLDDWSKRWPYTDEIVIHA